MCTVVRYVATLLSSLQCIEGFLMALKNFDYWCSVVFKEVCCQQLADFYCLFLFC